jgi:hypothetical protein
MEKHLEKIFVHQHLEIVYPIHQKFKSKKTSMNLIRYVRLTPNKKSQTNVYLGCTYLGLYMVEGFNKQSVNLRSNFACPFCPCHAITILNFANIIKCEYMNDA